MLGEVIDRGQLGIGSDDYERDVPTKINDISNIEDIYMYDASIYAITQDGSLYAWGDNDYGQLGIGEKESKVPKKVEIQEKIEKVINSMSNTFVITKDKKIYAWGNNSDGVLGIGNRETQYLPVKINLDADIEEIFLEYSSVYGKVAFAKTTLGEIYAWGSNEDGIFNIETKYQTLPTKIKNLNNVDKIYYSYGSCYAKTKTGEVYAWGENNVGQLGIGNKENQNIPVKVSNLSNVDNIYVCFGGYGFAQLNSGEVYAWGKNDKGQLGIGNTEDQSIPVKVTGLSNIVEINITSFIYSIYAKTKTGEVYAWGENDEGQLGLGNTENQNVPTKIEGLPNVANFLGGAIITSDGKLYSIRGKDYLPELITLDGKLYNNGEYVEGIGGDRLPCEDYKKDLTIIYSTNNVYINSHIVQDN